MREMKDSGIEWIGEIPKDWNLVPTKRLFINKKRIVGNAVDEYERLALTMNGVIKRSKVDSDGLQPEKFEGYQILQKNELVFKLIDLENVKTSRVGISPYDGIVSPAYIVLSNDIENKFYYYWFMFMYYHEVFNKLGGDGVRSSLNAKDLLSMPVPHIDSIIRNKIASYLDSKCSKIDDIIEKHQSVIEKLKAYKLSKLDELFNNFDGNNCHLGWICSLKNGLNFSFSDNGLKLKFLGVGDFKDYFVLSDKDMFSSIEVEDCIDKDYYLSNEDIVFVRSNGSKDLVGRAIMVDNINYPLVYSGFCIRLRNNRKDILDSKYLLYFFRSPNFRCQLAKFSQGSNINNINQYMLSHIDLKIPSLEYQKNIIEKLDKLNKAIDSTIANKQALIEKLTAYKKSLIYEVVTGKKEV